MMVLVTSVLCVMLSCVMVDEATQNQIIAPARIIIMEYVSVCFMNSNDMGYPQSKVKDLSVLN